MNNLVVAKAEEKVLAPVEFTGKLKRIIPITQKDANGAVKAHFVSMEIEGLPELYDNEGNKLSVLRTVKQAVSDLGFFGRKNSTIELVCLDFAGYAVGQDITLNISAHEAGAIFTVTEESNYNVKNGGDFKTGEEITLEKAGFYVEGFANIHFDKRDIREKAERLALATAEADANDF